MLKYISVSVVGLALVLSATDAFAGHRRCGGYSAPAPAVAPAPAPAPMAAAPQGNRTYSYQPTQPNYGPYGDWVTGRTGRAYENAANKSLGRGF